MKLVIATLVFALAACSANPSKPDRSQEEVAVDELDIAFQEHLATTALPRQVDGAHGFKRRLQTKTDGIKALERAYQGFTESTSESIRARAWRRIGQLYLNAGCEIATIDLGPVLAERGKVLLEGQAEPLTKRANEYFQKAAAQSGEHADASREATAALSEGLGVACPRLEAHWATVERPDVAPPPTKVDKTRCMKNAGIPDLSKGCAEVFAAECAKDDAHGCLGNGFSHWLRGDLDGALAEFDKACSLGEHCVEAAVVAAPANRESYRDACVAGEALGCVKLGRLLDPEGAVGRECTATTVPTIKDPAARCTAGQASGCFETAGALLRKKPIEFPTTKGGALMGVLGSLKTDESAEDRKARLAKECDAGTAQSCISLGGLHAADGKDPSDLFQKACNTSPYGCHRLAEHLLSTKSKPDTTRAVELLTKNCSDEYYSSCTVAARLFADGTAVKPSDACAAALAWNGCRPDRTWACSDINKIFGHSRKPAVP